MCGVLDDIKVDDSKEPWYLVFFEYEKCGGKTWLVLVHYRMGMMVSL